MNLDGIKYKDSLLFFEDMKKEASMILGNRHDYNGQI